MPHSLRETVKFMAVQGLGFVLIVGLVREHVAGAQQCVGECTGFSVESFVDDGDDGGDNDEVFETAGCFENGHLALCKWADLTRALEPNRAWVGLVNLVTNLLTGQGRASQSTHPRAPIPEQPAAAVILNPRPNQAFLVDAGRNFDLPIEIGFTADLLKKADWCLVVSYVATRVGSLPVTHFSITFTASLVHSQFGREDTSATSGLTSARFVRRITLSRRGEDGWQPALELRLVQAGSQAVILQRVRVHEAC